MIGGRRGEGTRPYQRNGRWYITVYRGGKKHRTVTECRNRTEAAELQLRLQAEENHASRGLPVKAKGTTTLGEIMTRYVKHHGPRSIDKVAGTIQNNVIDTRLGAMRVTKLNADHINRHLSELLQTMSSTSVIAIRGYILRAIKAAKRDRIIMVDPVDPDLLMTAKELRIKKPKDDSFKQTLTEYEIKDLIDIIPSGANPPVGFWAVACYAGLRKGEIVGLRKDCIDLVNDRLLVKWSYDQPTTKGGHVDAIPITKNLRPYLEQALAESTHPELVFPGPDGKMISRHFKAGVQLDRYLTHIGVYRKIRFHDLRHSVATNLVKRGVPLAMVSDYLRHRDFAFTKKTYVHLAPDSYREKVDALGDLEPRKPPRAVVKRRNKKEIAEAYKRLTEDRAALKAAIWREPMTRLAERYNVTETAIRKAAKKHRIKTPPMGHWKKKDRPT